VCLQRLLDKSGGISLNLCADLALSARQMQNAGRTHAKCIKNRAKDAWESGKEMFSRLNAREPDGHVVCGRSENALVLFAAAFYS